MEPKITSRGDILEAGNMRARPEIEAELIAALESAYHAKDKEGRFNSIEMSLAANKVLDLRETYTTKEGLTDYKGSSYGYRQKIREILNSLNVEESERTALLAGVRYHLGNQLRLRLTPDELETHNLLKTSPKERQLADRRATAKSLRVAELDEKVQKPNEVIAALRLVSVTLENLDFTAMSNTDKQVAEVFLAATLSQLHRLKASYAEGV